MQNMGSGAMNKTHEYRANVGLLLMAFGIRAHGANWGQYKERLVAKSDFRKFDNALRMVITGIAEQRQALTTYLAHSLRGAVFYMVFIILKPCC